MKCCGKHDRKLSLPLGKQTEAAEDYPTKVISCTSEAQIQIKAQTSEINDPDSQQSELENAPC